jgi:hypothetical protein
MEASTMADKYYLVLLIPFLLTGGCSGGDDGATPGASGRELMFEDQIQSLEKAEEVERILQEGADLRQQAVEQQAE